MSPNAGNRSQAGYSPERRPQWHSNGGPVRPASSPLTVSAGTSPSSAPRLQPTYPYQKYAAEVYRTLDVLVAVTVLVAAFITTNAEQTFHGLADFLVVRISADNLLLLGGLALVWPLIFLSMGLYERRTLDFGDWSLRQVVVASTLGTALVAVFPLFSASQAFSYTTVFWFWVAVIPTTLGARQLVWSVLAPSHAETTRKIVIVGSGPRALKLYREVCSGPDSHYELVGFVDTSTEECGVEIAQHMLGPLDQLENILMHHVVDEVLIALPIKSCYEQIQQALGTCERVGVEAKYLADMFQSSLARPTYDSVDRVPTVSLKVVQDDIRRSVKRVFDLIGAMLGLIVLSPLLLVIAIAIKLTSPGPVIFGQERYGLNKRRFRMYKFRTMVANAESLQITLEQQNEATGPVFKIREDPRVTPIGKFLRRTSLDELPQLWNVVRGEMSLIGPRPLPTRDVSNFSEAWPMRRFSVLPGLTCLWQVSGRSNLEFADWMALDLRYIDEWSLGLDMRILLLTIPAVFRGTGAA